MEMDIANIIPVTTDWALNNITKVATAGIMLLAGYYLAGFLAKQSRNLLPKTRRIDSTVAPLLAQVIRYGVIIITVVAALSQFGVQTTSILTVIGAAGLAIALALQSTLSNIASGVMLIWLRPFNVGDSIDAEGIAGTIKEIGLFATELRTYDGIYIFVPNQRLWNAQVTNYSRSASRMVETRIGIAYDADLGKARSMLLDIAKKDERVLSQPEPMVFVNNLGASSVDLIMRSWVKSSDWWRTNVDFQERAKLAFDASGIEIPYGKLDVFMKRTPAGSAEGAE